MNINFARLSPEGLNLALMSLNSLSGGMAASLILQRINTEQRLITEGRAAGKSDIDIQAEIDDLDNHHMLPDEEAQLDTGNDRPATVEEFCALFMATNTDLNLRREQSPKKNWPMVGTISNVLDFKIKSLPREPSEQQIKDFRLVISALKSEEVANALPDEQIKTLLLHDNTERQEYFAGEFAKHRKEIEDRMAEACGRYEATGNEESWETLLSNLPLTPKLMFLNGINRRLENKMKELAYGRKSDGSLSKGAGRNVMERVSDIAQHKLDQRAIDHEIHLLNNAGGESGPEALGSKSGVPGTSVKGAVPSPGKGLDPKEEVGTRQVSSTEFRGTKPKPASIEALKKLEETFTH